MIIRKEDATQQPKVHVHLDRGRGINTWQDRWQRSEVFDEWPYGYQHAAGQVEISYSTDGPENTPLNVLRRGMIRLLGFDLVHAWRNRHAIGRADMVWTHTEREHLAIALLVALGQVPHTVAVLGQSVWLWDRWPQLSRIRQRWYRQLLRRVAVHTTLSSENARVAATVVRGPVVSVPYGTRPLERLPAPPLPVDGRTRAVAPGNDRDRDWAMLGILTERVADLRVTVLSRRLPADHFAGSAGIRVQAAGSAPEVLDVYRQTDLVLVPLRPNRHASGITVALEAMNVGRPVVIADTGGIRDYLGDHAWYYTPGDADSLVTAVAAARAATEAQARAARDHVRAAGLTDRDYALRHAQLTRDVLTGSDPDPSVSQFRAVPD